MTHERPNIDNYFLAMAEAASERAECVRRRVGAIVVKNGRIVGHGFNGALPGAPSCLQGACPRATTNVDPGSNYSNCIADHAERNALRNTRAEDRQGSTVYINTAPCDGCLTLLVSVGADYAVWPSMLTGEPERIALRIYAGGV